MFTACSDTSDSDDTADQHAATTVAPATKTGSLLSIQGCPVRGLRICPINCQLTTNFSAKYQLTTNYLQHKWISEYEFLKNCPRRLSNLILKSGHFPGNWCEGITPIYKCGNKILQYGGMCVSSCMGNIFTTGCLANR